MKAHTKKGATEPGRSEFLEFSAFDESGWARLYLNLYEGGAWKKRWSRKVEAESLVDLAKVSNGCGGKGGDTIVKVQNFFGNTSTYTGEATGRSYTVSFVEACNLHDAGYGGQTRRTWS